MDGNASTVYVQQASSLLRLGPLGWQRIFFNRFGDSLLLYPRHIQLYKIWTLSLACVIAPPFLRLQSSCAIIAENILGRHHICTTKLSLSIWSNA